MRFDNGGTTGESTPDGDGGYKWLVVAMLWAVCLFNYADRLAIVSVFPVLKTEMHLSDVQLGVVGGAFMWVYAAAGSLAGLVGDRFSRKGLILGGLLFWSLVTLATGFATRYWHLVLFRALEGLGEAFYFPASMSLISDYHGPRTRSKAMSLHQSSVYAGTIVGGAVAGLCAERYGWRSGFYLFGTAGVLLAVVLLALLKEPPRDATDTGRAGLGSDCGAGFSLPMAKQAKACTTNLDDVLRALAELFTRPMVPVLMAVFIGANFVAAIFLTWLPSFLNRKFHMSLSMAGLNGTAWLQIASVLGVLTGGVLGDRWARRLASGRMLTQAVGLLAGVPFIFLTGWTRSVPVLVLAMAGFGYFKGVYDANIWASLYDVVRPARRATAVGVMNSLAWLGGGTAAVAIAAASNRWGMSACLSATSLIYLTVAVLLLAGVGLFMRERAGPAPVVPMGGEGFPVEVAGAGRDQVGS